MDDNENFIDVSLNNFPATGCCVVFREAEEEKAPPESNCRVIQWKTNFLFRSLAAMNEFSSSSPLAFSSISRSTRVIRRFIVRPASVWPPSGEIIFIIWRHVEETKTSIEETQISEGECPINQQNTVACRLLDTAMQSSGCCLEKTMRAAGLISHLGNYWQQLNLWLFPRRRRQLAICGNISGDCLVLSLSGN